MFTGEVLRQLRKQLWPPTPGEYNDTPETTLGPFSAFWAPSSLFNAFNVANHFLESRRLGEYNNIHKSHAKHLKYIFTP